jgi:hypothetical protein
VVIAAKTVVRSSYSRRVEAAADVYSVGLMQKAGGDPRALATILARVTADKDEGIIILADHPDTKDRVIAIDALAPAGASTPLLGAADWAALKQICAPANTPAGATTAPAGAATAAASGTPSASAAGSAYGKNPSSGLTAGSK